MPGASVPAAANWAVPMSRSKPIIGLCGGIGSGKSSVAHEFERLGALVIDSDRLNHAVLATPEVAAELRSWWGDEVIGPDGRPNRAALAARVFSDASARGRLERLVHPLIAARRAAMILRGAKDPAVRAIILDSPLLFESNLDRLCDWTVFVEASESRRLERLRSTRGWDERELRRREQTQLPPAEKRARCDYVIDNEGSCEELRPQVVRVFENIVSRHASSG